MVDCDDFGACSSTCGGGVQTCSRTCANGVFGEDGCPSDQEIKSQTCNPEECPCPPSTCWTEETDGSCTLKEDTCPDLAG